MVKFSLSSNQINSFSTVPNSLLSSSGKDSFLRYSLYFCNPNFWFIVRRVISKPLAWRERCNLWWLWLCMQKFSTKLMIHKFINYWHLLFRDLKTYFLFYLTLFLDFFGCFPFPLQYLNYWTLNIMSAGKYSWKILLSYNSNFHHLISIFRCYFWK